MKMKVKIIRVFFATFAIIIILFSCQSFEAITQVGAAAVGQITGYQVDPKIVDAIGKSGVAIGKAFEEITPEQEYYIGRAVGANVLAAYKIQTNNPAMTNYVNKICNALVINSPRPEIFNGYHANVLDTDEINAFATPGGHIFITRGLINCTSSEDALASVLAHEIAHIQLEHGLKAIKNSRITQAILITGTSTAGAAGYDLGEMTGVFSESVNEIVTTMVSNGYSRSQELDADSMAMSLLYLAGYEPSSLLEMLKVLEKEQGGHPGGFNKTHPTPAQRISNAERTVGNYKVEDTRSYRRARYAAVR